MSFKCFKISFRHARILGSAETKWKFNCEIVWFLVLGGWREGTLKKGIWIEGLNWGLEAVP